MLSPVSRHGLTELVSGWLYLDKRGLHRSFFARLSPGVLLLGAVRILLSAVIGFPEEGEGCMAAPGKTPGRGRGFGPRSSRKRRATSRSDERVVIAEVVAEDCFEYRVYAETLGNSSFGWYALRRRVACVATSFAAFQ